MTITTDITNSVLAEERARTLRAMVVARAWRDPRYRTRLVADPKPLLNAEGLEFPGDVEVQVLENTPTVTYVDLAGAGTGPDAVAALLGALLPLGEGHEIRVVQSTTSLHYLVLPVIPDGLQATVRQDGEPASIAAREVRDTLATVLVVATTYTYTSVDVSSYVTNVVFTSETSVVATTATVY